MEKKMEKQKKKKKSQKLVTLKGMEIVHRKSVFKKMIKHVVHDFPEELSNGIV